MPNTIEFDPKEIVSLLENGYQQGLYDGYEKNIALLNDSFHAYSENSGSPQNKNYCLGILAYMKALISESKRGGASKTVQHAMELIPIFIHLSCDCNEHGAEYKITFFEVLSHGFGPVDIMQIVDDFYSLRTQVPAKDYPAILHNMTHAAGGIALYNSAFNGGNAAKIMAKRLNNLLAYVKELNLRGWFIKPSGLNPHNGNRQTLFLSRKDGNPYICIYRPDMLPATAAAGHAVEWLNGLMDKGGVDKALLLPLVRVSVETGIQEMIPCVSSMTDEQAKIYYTQVGELLFLARLTGMCNIGGSSFVPTAAGPVITDVECVFNPWIIASDRLDSTLLLDAAALPAEGNWPGPFTQYAGQILAGYQNALDICLKFCSDTNLFSDALHEQRLQVKETCFAPLSTDDVEKLFLEYMKGTLNENSPAYQSFVSALELDYADFLEPKRLYDSLIGGFENGDVPYFTLRYSDVPAADEPPSCKAELCCNGSAFGYSNIYLPNFLQSLNFLGTDGLDQLSDFLKSQAPKTE